jgi:predicted PurR-regulated permease PerM
MDGPEPLGNPDPLRTEPVGSQMPGWVPRLLIYSLLAIGIGIALYHVIGQLADLIAILFSALFVSFALEPAVNWLAARGWRRGLATFAILLGLAILFVAFVASFVPLFLDQVRALVAALPGWLNRLNVYTERWFNLDISTTNVRDQLKSFDSTLANYAKNAAGNLFGIVTGVLGLVFRLLTIALFSFYMIAQGPQLRRAVCSLLPAKRQEEVLRTWEIGIEKTGGYVLSRLLLAGISAAASFVVLLALGVPFPFALALWIGTISQFVPTVGTYIAAAVPLIVTLFEKGAFGALVLLIYILVYQQIENYLLSPRITAHTMEMHPAVAFGSVIAGASLFGGTGALLALPAAATIQGTLSGYIRRHEVIESELTSPTPAVPPKDGRGSFRARMIKRFGREPDRTRG